MKVTEVTPNILCLEYKQEKGDKDYGSCLWARFTFNLDRYELTVTSDCGNYAYKWAETPYTESFLKLMARIDYDYMLIKLYGYADIFDYEKTKEAAYKWYVEDDEDIKKMDEIFENIEFSYIPDNSEDFIRKFDEENDGFFVDTWEIPRYKYPADALKIVSIFEECIKPKIKEIICEKAR